MLKKFILWFLAAAVLVTLVLGSLGIRHGRHLLASRPKRDQASTFPTVAWIPPAGTENQGPLLFDLHAVGRFPIEIRPPLFSTTSGWSLPENGGTWAIGPQAVFDFPLTSVSARTLVLNTNPTGDLFKKPQTASVTLNDNDLGHVKFSNANPLSTLRLPAETQNIGSNRLVFEFETTVRPSDRSDSGDSRPLAAWFRNITLLDGSFGPLEASIRTIRMFADLNVRRKQKPAFVTRTNRLVVRNEGTIVTTIQPDGHSTLELEIRPRSMARSLVVTAHDLTNRTAPAPLVVDERRSGAASATIMLPTEFETAFLEIEVPTVGEKPLIMTAPWLTTMASPPKNKPDLPKTPGGLPPNLVVVILDATRAGNVGCYGSDRPTTPHIDALAAGSVVIPEAVALAPYTLCSVPTMATGLSFFDHGVVARGQSLARASTTLAEVLLDAGYRTAGFSATPNNSKKLGVEQGFQVFEEAWKGVARGPALDPHRLVGMAVAWLSEVPSDTPYHIMIHMVPPHEPYEPGPAFDKFSDPGYQGPADGSRSFIDLFNADNSNANPEDLEQTRALYDGNLLKADDAVGQLLDVLRNRPDWDRTAVVVTADHGESLGEHQRIGHNAQVYETMVRVPFIMRLPKGVTAPLKDVTTQPASLADLPPTLAALAGLQLPGPLAGRNLMNPSATQPRAMVIRTAGEKPDFGVRTSRWKLVVTESLEMSLYDLQADPEEERDCATSHPVTTAGLRQILLRRLAAEPLFIAADETSLTDQDEAMLRTLGYLD